MQKLTNDELVTLSNPAIPNNVKNHLATQKMTNDEVKICRQCGTEPFEYAVSVSIEN